MSTRVRHRCDERCVCPIHRTPLFYAPASDEHACQDVDCIHGHGMNEDLPLGLPPAGVQRPGSETQP